MSIAKRIFMGLMLCLSLYANNVSANANLEIGIKAKNEGRYAIALMAFKPLLAIGYGGAQYQVAEMNEFGLGMEKDLKNASDLYHKAAKQGYAQAQFKLSRYYTDGTIVDKNLKLAYKWVRKAANLGLAAAQYNLAVLYHKGESVPLDYKQAFYWYKQAAYQNFVLAQYNLALMYFEGYGVKKSNTESYVWNTIAATNGYENALKSLEIDKRNLLPAEIRLARLQVVDELKKIETKRSDLN
jgi:TPR repeat protein